MQGRHRKLGPDCLEIAVASCCHMPLVFVMFLIHVIIYQGGSASPDTSNYRTPKEKRARSKAETGPRPSGNISYIWSPHAVVFGVFLVRVCIYQGGPVSPDTSNYRTPRGKRPRSTAEKELNCLEISVALGRSMSLVSGIFLIIVGIYNVGSVSHYTSDYRAPKENGPDRPLGLERGCLEISVMYCRPLSFGFRMFLIRVSIYQVGSVSLDTSNYRTPGPKVPDRHQKLEPGCLEISVTSGRPVR